jgi:hypothetical protein
MPRPVYGTRRFPMPSPEDPVGVDLYLGVGPAGTRRPQDVDVAFDRPTTHWGTQVMTVVTPRSRCNSPQKGASRPDVHPIRQPCSSGQALMLAESRGHDLSGYRAYGIAVRSTHKPDFAQF